VNPRILILSDPFAKPNFQPRLRYLCDYLQEQGWQVDVYTEPWDEIPFEHSYPIHTRPVYRGERGSLINRVDWAFKSMLSLLFDWRNRHFSSALSKAIADTRYDAVFCTTFSTFPLRAAEDVARRQRIPLYVDIRDVEEQVEGSLYHIHRQWWLRPIQFWYTRINVYRRNRVLRRANALTTVSPWHVDFLKQFNPNVHLVYNGYNPQLHYPQDIRRSKFIISYTGKFYEMPLHNPEPLFRALQRLKNTPYAQDIRLRVHTDERGVHILQKWARKYSVTSMLEVGGYISNEETANLYRESSIVLVLSNKEDNHGPHGMMTTKYFEAVGTEKPVLLVTSDGSHLAEAIERANAGLAATSDEQIVSFILEKYAEWKANGFTRQAVNQEERQRYSRERQAEQIAALFERKQRLLVMADPYGKPSFAPRLRYLSDYLTRHGWDVDIYTEQWDKLFFEHNYPITEIRLYNGERDSVLYRFDWFVKAVWSLLTDWKNRAFCREVRRHTAGRHYDALLCTTFSTFPLPAALRLSEEKHIPLYCDIRDLDEQVGGSQYQSHRQWWARPFRIWYRDANIRRRNDVLRKANALTTVSPWHVEFLQHINPQTHLIYNGYNPQIHYFEPIRTDTFTVSYIGRLYGQTSQDPTLLLEALRTVKDEMPELRLLIHTDPVGQERMRLLAMQYGLSGMTDVKGYVGIDAVPDLYRRSSVCVVLSNKADAEGPKGMMTTKFFEIIGTEKPLLLVRSDEAHLAEAIRATNAGLAATDTAQVVGFLRKVYAQWREQGYTHQDVNQSVVSLFNREMESAQFEQILSVTRHQQ